jgi:hypothetical protein
MKTKPFTLLNTALATILLVSLLLVGAIPSSSVGEYDPWCDLDDDGDIDIYDIVHMAGMYGSTGTPINKTALLLELQARVENLSTSLIALEERMAALEGIFKGGLMGYWTLDEGSGTIAQDSTVYSNHGTLAGGAHWVVGKHGQAVSFDGADDYVVVPDSLSLRIQQFTLEAWIYMDKRPYEHGEVNSAIINKLNFLGGEAFIGYKMQFNHPSQTNDNLVISIGDGEAQRFLVSYNSIDALTLNEWHHVAGTYNGSVAMIYIDGIVRASSEVQSYTIAHDGASLMLGGEYYYEGCNFQGIIDEARVYNKALTPEEILADMNG